MVTSAVVVLDSDGADTAVVLAGVPATVLLGAGGAVSRPASVPAPHAANSPTPTRPTHQRRTCQNLRESAWVAASARNQPSTPGVRRLGSNRAMKSLVAHLITRSPATM